MDGFKYLNHATYTRETITYIVHIASKGNRKICDVMRRNVERDERKSGRVKL